MMQNIVIGPHFLGIAGLTASALNTLLDRVAWFATEPAVAESHRGKSVVNLFYENSTRTRTSFELAAKKLGAEVINIDIATSSAKKGETLADTVRTINAMGVDAIIIRHSESGTAQQVADLVDCAVINAGDGANEHPTQALLDAFTMRQRKGRLEGLQVAICGDIKHSRVARSNIALLGKLGAQLRLIAPPALMPDDSPASATRYADLATGLRNADVVMMLRIQFERMQGESQPDLAAYQAAYRLDRAKLACARPDAIVMHPGPLNRMIEITDDVADDPERSVILTQVRNGIYARMAVLDMLLDR